MKNATLRSNYQLFTENLCRFNYNSAASVPSQTLTFSPAVTHNNKSSNCICPPGFGGLDCEIRKMVLRLKDKIFPFYKSFNCKFSIDHLYLI